MNIKYTLPIFSMLLGLSASAEEAIAPMTADTANAAAQQAQFMVNNVWMMCCACLVFIMHLGFCCLEIGLTRAKNTVNIIFKNFSIVAICTLVYALVGFSLMYPGTNEGGWFGFAGFGIGLPDGGETIAYAEGAYTYWTDFLFQAMFAAATASIVSGAVCERIKIHSFLIFCVLYAGVAYPIIGMWQWGGGYLSTHGFYDLAGSGLVHTVGGCAALVGAWMLGPRIGKYVDGKPRAIMGHSLPLASIGAFLLWFGWFGFNAGSILSAAPGDTSRVMVMTLLAACAGVVGAVSISWIVTKKPDLTMALNGALAGLVGITAGADQVGPSDSVIIGFIAGLIVVLVVYALDLALRIDDPVGAIAVHMCCGIWGVLAVGIFSDNKDITFMAQLKGIAIIVGAALAFSFLFWGIIKAIFGLRVHEEEEILGLDIGEHGMEAYSGFQIFNNQ